MNLGVIKSQKINSSKEVTKRLHESNKRMNANKKALDLHKLNIELLINKLNS